MYCHILILLLLLVVHTHLAAMLKTFHKDAFIYVLNVASYKQIHSLLIKVVLQYIHEYYSQVLRYINF